MLDGDKDTIHSMVYKTTDYSKFRMLEGNRAVLNTRKQKIRKSIDVHGQLFSPIIVNEKMQIIDGQARYEVFREKNLPIYYIMEQGLSVEDCQTLNSTGTPWTLKDYIDSYEVQGNENYIRLNRLIKAHRLCSIRAVLFAAIGIADTHGSDKNNVKEGRLTVNESDFAKADQLLSYAERFIPGCAPGCGDKTYLLMAAIFCCGVNGIDKERLVDKWIKYGNIKSIKSPFVSIRDAIATLEKAYNYRSSSESVLYIESEYDKHCRQQNASYATRWGSKIKKQNGGTSK